MKSSFARALALSLSFITLLALSFFPTRANACACCADWGEWAEETRAIQEYEIQEINSLNLSNEARLFLTAAADESIKGVADLGDTLQQPFDMRLTRDGQKWTMVFNTATGKRGALVFTIPETATYFRADLHDGKQGGGGGPLLYKEVRMSGHAWGNGIFASGITADTQFRLVLQGRGNRCLSSQDFRNWNLQVSGPKAAYSFYGSFAKPVEQKKK